LDNLLFRQFSQQPSLQLSQRVAVLLWAVLIASPSYGEGIPILNGSDHNILTTIALLIACGIIQLIIILRLYSRFRELNFREKDLKNRYELLNKQLTERSDKLYKINNQLYEEIAKHETTGEQHH